MLAKLVAQFKWAESVLIVNKEIVLSKTYLHKIIQYEQ